MGFPVRTKGTGNTEHLFSQWSLVAQGTGTSQSSEARRPAGPPESKESNREQGTGNREQGTCRVPRTCSGTTSGKPIAEVFHKNFPDGPSKKRVSIFFTKLLHHPVPLT